MPFPATVVTVPDGSTLTIRLPRMSARYTFPAPSTATFVELTWATVLMMPDGVTLRKTAPEIYRLPAPSTATPETVICAFVAGPPSPEPLVPPPAAVVMVPAAFTLQTRLAPPSAM